MSPEPQFSPLAFPALRADTLDADLDQARTRGHAAGYAAGLRLAAAEADARAARLAEQQFRDRESARASVASAVHALEIAAALFAQRSLPVLAEADAALADAALDLATTIVGWREGDAELFAMAAARRALAETQAAEVLRVRLNPDDLELIGESAELLARVTVVADPTVERGDALVDLEDGRIDARIGAAVARATAAIRGEWA
ncbi:FliH/SctL family protein [Galbitalea soli]|uniref:Flagellar assembly protein FliH/Type III secretion system HrpE domain-containing protein n=1 Tax=Galbitalea soli TaxID=1268042 RepID=A0A7C9TQG9_9MICO|nr:FliH/SctL family protein [Galbitalea soli]NEM91175.1 hypothetical protein [Galbitalea soli]NYJ29864.1 flagellar assembly protein FliH [Galbitalea soli]